MRPDITLVHPLFINMDPIEEKLMTPYFPLGLMYLGAGLREAGYQVDLFDCAFRQDYQEFEEYMKTVRPEIVGITSLITIRKHALVIANLAKQYGAKVILGGPDPTGIPDRYLYYRNQAGDYPVDAVAYDEADITIIDLVDHHYMNGAYIQNADEIPGLRLRDDKGGVKITPGRPLITDLDSLLFPARDMVDLGEYKSAWKKAHGYWSLSLINSRGCPYGCSWCQKAVFGRSFRIRSPQNSAQEMKLIKDTYSPDQIRIVDDITGVKKKWVNDWKEEVLDQDAAIPFECLTRVNLATQEMISDLKAIGCKKIFFGAESGSQKVLDAMDKGAKVDQIYRAAELCKRMNIETYFFMMVGYPGEEWEDLLLSRKLIVEALPDSFSTTIAYPLPGTKFYEQVRDRLMFESDWMLDWDYTAENRLLFKRGKYNTFFYRLVRRWFTREWENAWIKQGRKFPLRKRVRIPIELIFIRVLLRIIVAFPGSGVIQFEPAKGR